MILYKDKVGKEHELIKVQRGFYWLRDTHTLMVFGYGRDAFNKTFIEAAA